MKASLKKILAIDSSRTIADIAITEVNKNQKLFTEAMAIANKDVYPLSMRAARVVDECAEQNPLLIEPYIDEMIERLPLYKIDGVKRGFLRFFANSKIRLNASQRGHLVETCFDFLSSPSSSIAIRYYSLSILYKLSNKEKALKPELLEAIEDGLLRNRFTHGSSVLKIRKKLYQEIQHHG